MARGTVTVSGFRELEEALSELAKSTGTGVLRRAGMKAMQPMADLAKSLAPDDAETPPLDLRTSIIVASGARTGSMGLQDVEKGGRATIFMGPRWDIPRYARVNVAEFGSFKMKAQPYMRPAWHQDSGALLDRLKVTIRAEIDKTVARAAVRAAKAKV